MLNITPTSTQLLQRAIAHHQAGRLAEAELLYRQILAQQSNHPEALRLLGILAGQINHPDLAIELLRRVISLQPENGDAWLNLGNILQSQNQLPEAIKCHHQATLFLPNYAAAFSNLGNALCADNQLDEALDACRHAITLNPSLPEAHNNLGNVLLAKKQMHEAIASYQQAIALRPHYAAAHFNLASILHAQGDLDAAIASYQRAIAADPNLFDAHFQLGNLLQRLQIFDDAIACYLRARALNPTHAITHNELANVLKARGRMEEAIASYRQHLALAPDSAIGHNNLGVALADIGRTEEAIVSYQRAAAINPNYSSPFANLGSAWKDLGNLDASIANFRRALALAPYSAEIHSKLLYTLSFDPHQTAQTIAKEAERWNQQHALPLAHSIRPHANDRISDRKIRIAYISPDFWNHCQAQFMIPLLANHDRTNFHITCYSDVLNPDAATARLRAHADAWQTILGRTDEQVAAQIRADRIDILIDLTMHMARNRLLVLARKPAPVQLSWLAYPGTTGLTAIDYRLTDPHLDPPGIDESVYAEKTLRLPDTFWCYDPLAADPPVNPLPALANGHLTFGCFNNFCKINEGTIQLWSRVLTAIPNSRLMLLCPEGQHRAALLEKFQRAGIAPTRIDLHSFRPRRQYLELYHRIDIGLDTLPYNGHTTSLDSFWMGVPVITLIGPTLVGRAGFSQLQNLNLPELIAHDEPQFIHIAQTLANNLPHLKELRTTLRQRLESSPLMNAPRFARNLETLYRQIWQHWCISSASHP